MKELGYKGYKNDLTCKGKQYAENTVFEEKEANICKNGMHFCKNPFDVLDYYPLINSDGTQNEFTDVEALEKCEKYNKLYCTTKLKVGHKLGIIGFVEACVEYFKKEIKDNDIYNNVISDGRDNAQIASFCDSAQVASSGDTAQIASSGCNTKISSSGYGAQISSSGDYSQAASSGLFAHVASSGDNTKVASSGRYSNVASCGKYSQIASCGNYAQIASCGDSAQIASSGDNTKVASSGYYAQVASSGQYAQIASSGDSAQIESSGENAVVMCAGCNSIAKAKKGSWIALAEWKYDEDKREYIPVCVKTELVDGKRIKEDVSYKLVDGKFMEV